MSTTAQYHIEVEVLFLDSLDNCLEILQIPSFVKQYRQNSKLKKTDPESFTLTTPNTENQYKSFSNTAPHTLPLFPAERGPL